MTRITLIDPKEATGTSVQDQLLPDNPPDIAHR